MSTAIEGNTGNDHIPETAAAMSYKEYIYF